MTDSMFAAPGRFFRGNLHTHSNRSDGVLSAEEVCRRYKTQGYDFIALTDHFIGRYDFPITDTKPFRDNQFTTILGAEIHSGAMNNGEIWHILAVGLPEDFERSNTPDFRVLDGQETGPEIARRAREAGAYVAVAHPQWSGMSLDDARSIDAAHAIEIYNHGCAVGSDRADGFHVLDLLLTEGRRLNLCATDDSHFAEADHFGGWVMVKAQENHPDSLLQALKDGHSYSSQGPEFRNIAWNSASVEVESSSVASVIVQGRGSATSAVHGEAMTRTQVPLGRLADLPWLRVTLVDHAGRRAWCNPVWF
ncbi:MAG: CehA/McbA family metallohydrolase [Pseudomonadota bacterium]